MFWLVLWCSVVGALWCLNRLMKGKEMDVYEKIPGPKMMPFLGNALDMLADRVQVFYLTRKWTSEYKDIFKFFAPPVKTISIYNPDDIEAVISTLKFNEKSVIYTFMEPWLGDGLLLSHGLKWQSRRKILTPAFHFNILRHFTYILEENSWNMVDKLKKYEEHKKINIVPLISEYTLNSICETAMGKKLDEKDSGEGVRYKQAIHKIGALILNRMTRVWLLNSFIFRLSQTAREQNTVLKEIKSFPKRVIDDRRKYREEFGEEMFIQGNDNDLHMNKKKKMAMLDLLLSAEKEGLINAEGIQEEVDTFMFEGHDTTAMGLIFTLMLLANHEDAQNRIVEECKGILGDKDRPASMSELQEMKYLECCIKEGLRLYPPVPFISRRIGESLKLKNYTIPVGTTCNMHIYDLHRRGDLFREPLQFIPERFLPGHPAGTHDSTHPFAYIPFSAGPRNCIGQKFAMLEMKSAISAILRVFRLEPVTKPQDVIFTADLVLRPHNNIYVQFVKRK